MFQPCLLIRTSITSELRSDPVSIGEVSGREGPRTALPPSQPGLGSGLEEDKQSHY